MENNTIDLVKKDSFLVALQPFYGLLREELLRKIKYLKQELFWNKVKGYQPGYLVDRYMNTLRKQQSPSVWMKRREYFEALLKKHGLTFAPLTGSPELYLDESVIGVDAHLCSGIKGNWSLSGNNFVGFGLKIFSSQREYAKYIGFANEICHRSQRLNIDHFHTDKNLEENDSIEMLDTLENGFKEVFVCFDKFILCCKDFHNDAVSKLRSEVGVLEYQVFWSSVNKFQISLPIKISEHSLSYSKRSLKIIVVEGKDLWVEWRLEFERLVSSFDLTFGPGETDCCVIEGNKIQLDRKKTHLCSGRDGKWKMGVGFGRLMLSDSRARKNYLGLLEHIKDYCSQPFI